jgi:hypothetical protein
MRQRQTQLDLVARNIRVPSPLLLRESRRYRRSEGPRRGSDGLPGDVKGVHDVVRWGGGTMACGNEVRFRCSLCMLPSFDGQNRWKSWRAGGPGHVMRFDVPNLPLKRRLLIARASAVQWQI